MSSCAEMLAPLVPIQVAEATVLCDHLGALSCRPVGRVGLCLVPSGDVHEALRASSLASVRQAIWGKNGRKDRKLTMAPTTQHTGPLPFLGYARC